MNHTISATYGALRAAIVHAASQAQTHAHDAAAQPATNGRRWFGPRDHTDERARAAADFLAVYPSGSGR